MYVESGRLIATVTGKLHWKLSLLLEVEKTKAAEVAVATAAVLLLSFER